MSIEPRAANEVDPSSARYTLYPAMGSVEPVGAAQLNSTWCGLPVPLRLTDAVEFVEELLLTVNCPVAAPAAVGSKVSVTLMAWPGFSVAGRLTGEAAKPLPVTATEFTVTGAVPVEVSVSVWVVALLTTTAPNAMLPVFRVRAGVAAFNCSESVCEVLPVDAVSVTDCALVTAAALAEKAAVFAVAGTVIELGTVTELLLLEIETLRPPVGAEPDRVTVQASASAPVIEVLLQDTALTVGVTVVPVPLRLTVAVGALLAIVNCPVEELALVGLN